MRSKNELFWDVLMANSRPDLDFMQGKGGIWTPKIELEQAKGFGLYMLHETFDGQIGEVIDTLKTNFLI